MKHVLAALLPLAAALAACDSGEQPQNVTHISVANPESDRLKALSPLYQRIGLMRAIRDSGRHCRRSMRSAIRRNIVASTVGVALYAIAAASIGRSSSPPNDARSRLQRKRPAGPADLPPVAQLPPDPNAPANAQPGREAQTNTH